MAGIQDDKTHRTMPFLDSCDQRLVVIVIVEVAGTVGAVVVYAWLLSFFELIKSALTLLHRAPWGQYDTRLHPVCERYLCDVMY